MSQPTIDESGKLFEDLDFIFDNNNIQVSTEKNNLSSQDGGDEDRALYEFETDDMNMTLFAEQSFRDLINDSQSFDQFPFSCPDMVLVEDLLATNIDVVPSTESNDIDEPIQSATDEQLAMIRNANSTLSSSRPQNEKLGTKISSDHSINLSRSVAVTNPTPNSLQLVHQLEDTYRPRYKSDYFPSKGAVRRPRYVSDNAGHHYVSLQMPIESPPDLKNKYVRVALLTVLSDGQGHFYSPYKFQQDHNDMKIPDENPIFLPVDENEGVMKLHLVLIKSKLDQLNQAQPLKPFSDRTETIRNIIPQGKLAPKDLIAKYQLDKSHIAFTLCTKLPDGTYELYHETTTISSIITEISSKPTSNANNNKSEKTTVSVGKKVTCPHCSHCFHMNEGETKQQNEKKRSSNAKSSSDWQSNKKKKMF